MRWLRLYNEARIDAKLESLPDDEFRVWFRLLCFANEQPERGLIANFTPRLLAVEVARGDVALLQRTLASLQELRIIETCDDAHHFIHWETRQFKSDNVTERVVKHREGAKQQDETLQKRFRNDGVTPPDTDTEADTELETETTGKDIPVSFAPRASIASASCADAHNQTDVMPAPKRKTTKTPTPATPVEPAEPKTRPRNEWWDALVEVFGYEPKTPAESSKWGKVVKDLRAAQATGDDIRLAKTNYDARVASGIINWPLSPPALSSHFGELLQTQRDTTREVSSNGQIAVNGHNGHNSGRSGYGARPQRRQVDLPDPTRNGRYAHLVKSYPDDE